MAAVEKLTQFQIDCEAAVRDALAEVGCTIEGREILGANETYIRARLAQSDLVLYIYEDEAQFHDASGLVGLFEAPDYPTPEELQRAFVAQVVGAAGSRLAAN